MWDPYAEFESATLPNGLTVHAACWPGRPWEAMGFLIHSGAEHDPVGLEGLAHFVEHLVSENIDVPQKEMCGFFEDCGGAVNFGSTGYPYTSYRFFVPANKSVIAKAFLMFGQMLLSAKIEKSIERERQVIIEEFNQKYPIKLNLELDIRKCKALHTGHWLERFVAPLGNPESVGRITQNELQSCYDKHYSPANISIVGVGGMTLSEIVELLCKSPFAANKKGIRTPLPTLLNDVALPSETRYVFETSKYVTFPFEVGSYYSVSKIPGSINVQTIHVLQKMLDDLLYEEVRERRAWTYCINSCRCNFRHFHEFSIECSALVLKAINSIEEVIEACITAIGDREDLFEQIKQRTIAGSLMVDPTGKGVCNGALDDLADYQRIISLVEYRNKFELITMNDVQDFLQWLRPERRWTLIRRP